VKVTGYSWFGIATDDVRTNAEFFSDVLGLKTTSTGKKISILELPSGQVFEIIGPESRWAEFHNKPVLAFDVDDIYSAKDEMEVKGVKFLTEIVTFGEGGAFCYFEGPDGIVYSLSQNSNET
jgi:predicted enzyme related to lactoylglutathione lyase